MIYQKEVFTAPCPYPLHRLGTPERLLFFDIETTGLSAGKSSLYLIGALSFDGSQWKLVQWMAQRFLEEEQVLRAFTAYCAEYDTLVHFNGDTFDIPFLKACAGQYNLSMPFDQMNSIDLLKQIRPLKSLLSLDNLKLKTIERFLKIDREDQYTGGELISVYKTYTNHQSEELKHLLLLHNAEDLKNLPPLLSVLFYKDLSECKLTVLSCVQTEDTLQIACQLAFAVPKDIRFSLSSASFHLEADHLDVTFPLYTGKLRYFYPNYREYYYLPLEDYAIHKKVAQFVDPAHRKKATAKTAYTWQEGCYLPLPAGKKAVSELTLSGETIPVLREEYSSRDCYILFQPERAFLEAYLQLFLQTMSR